MESRVKGFGGKKRRRRGRRDAHATLLSSARAGDRRAAEELLLLLSAPLRRFLRGTLAQGEDLDDMLQDSLVAVWGALERFRGECTVLHFAIAVARRSTLGRRRARLDLTTVDSLDAEREGEPVELPVADADDWPAQRFRLRALAQLFGALPPVQVHALTLLATGHTAPEIAEIAGVPVPTVRSRLRRARKGVTKALETNVELRELLDP